MTGFERQLARLSADPLEESRGLREAFGSGALAVGLQREGLLGPASARQWVAGDLVSGAAKEMPDAERQVFDPLQAGLLAGGPSEKSVDDLDEGAAREGSWASNDMKEALVEAAHPVVT